jgi:hypothetical protein
MLQYPHIYVTGIFMEQWLDVVGFEDIYEVSDHGRVRSKITQKFKKITFAKDDGRPYLNIWKFGQQKIVRPHRLVLEAFVGKCPDGMECCHNDGNHQNNHISNLRWDTPKNNSVDKIRHGTTNRGERCGTAKLTLKQVNAIRKDDRLQRIIAEEYGVRQSVISRIKNGVLWQHDF